MGRVRQPTGAGDLTKIIDKNGQRELYARPSPEHPHDRYVYRQTVITGPPLMAEFCTDMCDTNERESSTAGRPSPPRQLPAG